MYLTYDAAVIVAIAIVVFLFLLFVAVKIVKSNVLSMIFGVEITIIGGVITISFNDEVKLLGFLVMFFGFLICIISTFKKHSKE